jgi:hypothetical protein
MKDGHCQTEFAEGKIRMAIKHPDKFRQTRIKTIGMFAKRLYNGGLARVASHLVDVFS